MNNLKLKRGHVKGCLTRAAYFAESIDERVSLELIEIRLQKLEEAWEEFVALEHQLLDLGEEADNADSESDFADYESKYFLAQSIFTKTIRDRQKCDAPVSDPVVNQLANQQDSSLKQIDSPRTPAYISLPKLNIPVFSGHYKQWPSFRDLFIGSIDSNASLTPTQKFQYLQSFLRDEASNLIRHITVSDANYVDAWDRLEKRYDRSNLIVQTHIQSFLSMPIMSSASVPSLRKITDCTDETIRGLNALKCNSRDPWVIFILLQKLDSETRQAWAEESGTRDNCTIEELLEFLNQRCDALEACQSISRLNHSRGKTSKPIHSHFAESNQTCPYCKLNHILPQCAQFIAWNIDSRRNFVKANSLCFNCLRAGHASNKCRSTFRCRVCKSRHHSLVHPLDGTLSPASSSHSPSLNHPTSSGPSTSSPLPQIVNNHSLEVSNSKQTVLPTVLAKVRDNLGKLVNCRVLLDSGSQVSFVLESFVQRIGLRRKHARIPIVGLSSSEAGFTRGCVTLSLCSRFNGDHLLVDAFVLNKLTSYLPSKPFDINGWSHIKNLELADPCFNIPGPIDVLLGADKIWNILEAGQVRGSQGFPLAQKTSFGWVVTGEFSCPDVSPQLSVSSLHSLLDVDGLLQRFWEIEEVTSPSKQSLADDQAEIHFQKTFSRASDGKYVVHLPFKDSIPTFGNSLKSAVSRLLSMERRFRTDPNLQTLYVKFMKEYLDLRHMERIPPDELEDTTGYHFYLPHHAVLKPESKTTKLRVVFDGSAKDSLGNSLNNSLLVGPPMQRDLFGVCLRFRQHRFVFTADVVKMFRQIWVERTDTDFQRIVWRENPSDEIQHFRLCTVTYGTASAPFLSIRVLQQLATDYKSRYPNASRVLLNDVYVDDIMTGAETEESLINLQSELVALMSEAKLTLRKWNSNCWSLIALLPKEDCELSWVDTERSKSLIKVLGMYWLPPSDDLSFRISDSIPSHSSSRRTLLSEIARIFDPLGLLAPSVILFKMLFQELWSSEHNLSWDDPLPSHLSAKWNSYRQELHFLENIQVPRCIFAQSFEIELHGFADASSLAYAAVVYARCRMVTGDFKTTLIAAKTKVAPIKPVSIPRLELCGALLLSRLISKVTSCFTVSFNRIVAWSDSEIVLHWLSSPPRRWTTFVANRTAAILETIPRHSWHHVPSESNPADCASRGISPSKLVSHPLWWTGPSWLSSPRSCWPVTKMSNIPPENTTYSSEERPTAKQVFLLSTEPNALQMLIEKLSSWPRLQRIVAYCVRFISNCRTNSTYRARRGLTLTELQQAKTIIIKHVQQSSFKEEIHHLTSFRELPAKSKLLRYSAFLDNDGLLRVGGRIKHADISYAMKHPIILPNHHLSYIIATHIHTSNLHTGVSETFALVRQQYWIMGSRNLIRKIVHICKICFMQRKKTSSQLMGDLPPPRIRPSRPFSNTGCDYAGPFTIKLSLCRKPKLSKAYVAVFVCLSTKAIHLELVSDLTTDAFLAAFRRFVSRRGKCANIYTDNGTNFHGARRCLTEMHKLILSQTHNDIIAESLALDGTAWHFIPPSAPHFGGLWEAGVKSVKLHLRRVVGSANLTFEEFYTVLTQIEGILNSRPLYYISDDDINPLTPSHFLIGEPISAVPEPYLLDTSSNRLSHWNYLQNMVQGFWKRWQNEYITTLQERPKWQQATDNIKIGDVVVIKEPNLPPTKWLLGQIESIHPGSDARVRVATIRTSRGSFVRPITKLAVLPKA